MLTMLEEHVYESEETYASRLPMEPNAEATFLGMSPPRQTVSAVRSI